MTAGTRPPAAPKGCACATCPSRPTCSRWELEDLDADDEALVAKLVDDADLWRDDGYTPTDDFRDWPGARRAPWDPSRLLALGRNLVGPRAGPRRPK